jgi:hypothetical protein
MSASREIVGRVRLGARPSSAHASANKQQVEQRDTPKPKNLVYNFRSKIRVLRGVPAVGGSRMLGAESPWRNKVSLPSTHYELDNPWTTCIS